MLNAIMTFKYENVFSRFKNSSLIDFLKKCKSAYYFINGIGLYYMCARLLVCEALMYIQTDLNVFYNFFFFFFIEV